MRAELRASRRELAAAEAEVSKTRRALEAAAESVPWLGIESFEQYQTRRLATGRPHLAAFQAALVRCVKARQKVETLQAEG